MSTTTHGSSRRGTTAHDTPHEVEPLTTTDATTAVPTATQPTSPAPRTSAAGGVTPSRAGAVWTGAVVAAVVVIALVIFIAQNSQHVAIHFLWLNGHFSLALALVVAAVGGIVLAAVPGTLRILQLRHSVKTAVKTDPVTGRR